jgi:hypothetical protein
MYTREKIYFSDKPAGHLFYLDHVLLWAIWIRPVRFTHTYIALFRFCWICVAGVCVCLSIYLSLCIYILARYIWSARNSKLSVCLVRWGGMGMASSLFFGWIVFGLERWVRPNFVSYVWGIETGWHECSSWWIAVAHHAFEFYLWWTINLLLCLINLQVRSERYL